MTTWKTLKTIVLSDIKLIWHSRKGWRTDQWLPGVRRWSDYKGEAWEKFGLFCIFTVWVGPQIYVYVENHRSVLIEVPPQKTTSNFKKITATHWKWFLLYFIHHFQVFVAEEFSGYLTLPSYQNWAASWYFEPFISRPLPPSSPATHSHVHTLDLTAINYCTSEICCKIQGAGGGR